MSDLPWFYVVRSEHVLPEAVGGVWDAARTVSDAWYHCLFAGEVPYLQDVPPDLDAASRQRRAMDVLQSQIQFVQGLGHYADQRVTVALRFVVRPSKRRIHIFVCARAAERSSDAARDLAGGLWHDLHGSFPRAYALEPIGDRDGFLGGPYNPFAFRHISAVRQREFLTSSGVYVVLPFLWRSNSFAELFRTLLSSPHPLMVSVQLAPTRLDDREREAIAYIASRLAEMGEQQFQGYAGQQKIVDVEASSAAQTYRGLLAQLDQPFLMIIEVASAEPLPRGIPGALAAEVSSPSESLMGEQEQREPHARQSGTAADVVQPDSFGQRLVALRNLYFLETAAWGPSLAPDIEELPLHRLRHLFSAREANCAFRIPVPQHDGIDGVPIRAAVPFRQDFTSRRAGSDQALHLGGMIHRAKAGSDSFTIDVGDLNRHALIVGTTGSGKTATCLYLLDQLWKRFHVPFLVIEPVKSEYRTLRAVEGFEDLRIFTGGDDTASPLRLNPFEFDPDLRLARHLGGLKSVFTSVLPMVGPLPMILESCLQQIYADRGWQTSDDGSRGEQLGFPTLTDLYQAIAGKIDQLNYAGEVRANIEAASKVRIGSLRAGGKGRMLDVRRSIPIGDLLAGPAVIELKNVADPDEKALVVGLLLLRVSEYCEVGRGAEGGLRHVTVLEEAHRLLRNTASGARGEEEGNARGQAVESICDMLSEIRAYGEGIVIVDQYPSRLAPDAVKNTSLKVMLRLPAEDDRAALGSTMRFTDEQTRFCAGLTIGQAAVFSAGMEGAVLTQFPNYKSAAGIENRSLTDEEVRTGMQAWWADRAAILRPLAGCALCETRDRCPYLERTQPLVQDEAARADLAPALLGVFAGGGLRPAVQAIGRKLQQTIRGRLTREELVGAAYCLTCQLAEELVRDKAAEAGTGDAKTAGLLEAFADAAHASLASKDVEDRLPAIREAAARAFQPMFPPTDACDPCRRQCFFRAQAVRAIQDPAFQKAVTEAHRNKDLAGIASACRDAARRAVTGADAESETWAAYCCFLAEMQRRGTQDLAGMAEMFLKQAAGD